MPRFAYEAYSTDGKHKTGEIEASDDAAALDAIAARGLTPVSLRQGHKAGPWWSREISLSGGSPSLTPAETQQFFTMLSALLSAHLPLIKALEFSKSNARRHRMRLVLSEIGEKVSSGSTLAQAMRAGKHGFPERYITMVELGEASNTLALAVENLVKFISAETRTRQQLRSALIYPGILMVMSGLVLALVVFYLVPTLLPVFASAGTEAPPVIRVLGSLRNTILTSWPLLLIISIIVSVSLALLSRVISPKLSRFKLRLPIIGRYFVQRETQHISQMLASLLESGATLTGALRTAKGSTTMQPYEEFLGNTLTHIEAGGGLSDVFSASPLIDRMAKPLIQAGEESDSLAPMLAAVAAALEEQTATTLERAIGIITPALTLTIGLGIGAVILSIISAILDLNDIAF